MKCVNNSRRFRTSRGIGLMDMLIVLLLFAAFVVISAELFTSIFRAQRDYRARERTIAQIDNVLDILRRDVWAATATRATAARLELDGPTGQIVWQMSANGTLTRSAATLPPHNWSPLPMLNFSVEGPLVTLKTAGDHGKDEVVVLMSERLFTQANAGGGL